MAGRQAEAVTLSWQRISEKYHALPTSNSSSACFADAATAAAATAVGITSSALASDCRDKKLQGRESLASAIGSTLDDQGRGNLECTAISVDAEPFNGDRGGSLTVACVRWGRKYGPEYVQRLASGVRRNLSNRDYKFVCFTDDVGALEGMVGVEARPLGERFREWVGWWHKAFLFSR